MLYLFRTHRSHYFLPRSHSATSMATLLTVRVDVGVVKQKMSVKGKNQLAKKSFFAVDFT